MKVIHQPAELMALRQVWQEKSVGFVPTMGALHGGHEKLLQKSKSENDVSVLSIYVNPTQFNDKTDFEKYPVTLEADLQMAEANRVDAVFVPNFKDLYPDQFNYRIHEQKFSHELCGEHRPGHFDGVLTVVMKLLNIVLPTRAYFGEKDFQQLTLIQGMAQAFFLPVEIVAVATVREVDGLAMSSRNLRLTAEQRKMAPEVFSAISSLPSAEQAKRKLQELGFDVDYVCDISNRRYAAAKIGEVRLIDNVKI
jgi:pantoate--beta-alanine ligase